MLVLCTAFWALSFPTMKALTMAQQALVPGADSWFFSGLDVMWRFGLAGLVMGLLCLRTWRQLNRCEIEQGLGLAVFGAGGIVLQMDGLAHTSASTSAFLTQCYCLLIPLWVAWRRRQGPPVKVLISCLLVLIGAALLAGVDWRQLLDWRRAHPGRGEVETLLASILFAGQILWLERPHYRLNRVNHFSCVMFLAMAVLCAPVAMLTAPNAAAWWRAWQAPATVGFLGLLVVFSTLGGYMLMNYWQPCVTATEAGLIYCVEPVFASLLALVLPGWFSQWAGIDYANEQITPHLLLGGALITCANVLLQWRPRQAPEPARDGSAEGHG